MMKLELHQARRKSSLARSPGWWKGRTSRARAGTDRAGGRWSLAVLAACLAISQTEAQQPTGHARFEEDLYSQTEAGGPVAELQKQIAAGQVHLEYDRSQGYLRSLLEALKVPAASQLLVFSKTSSQRERISPSTPRALYFNDNVYVAWIPGSPSLEISCVDPRLGAVFYTLDQAPGPTPRFSRRNQCLECHTSAKGLGVPGYLVRSLATDENGAVDLSDGISMVTHLTPISARWGGWYVCGQHGDQVHRGNLIGRNAFDQQNARPNYLGNVTDLTRFLDLARYPQPGSDIVAMMVLDHQTHMQNLLTRLNYEAASVMQRSGNMDELKGLADVFLRYLLFADEAAMTSPITGTSGFAAAFASQGPRDHQGRSLRQFDLKTRLFEYPCSYMIYSDSFEHLPRPMKLYLYRRLWNILSGSDPAFPNIPESTRSAIKDILIETKSGLPIYWTLEITGTSGDSITNPGFRPQRF